MSFKYKRGAELGDGKITWNDELTGLIDFSTGWTWTLRIGDEGTTAIITKTTGISGAATAPNVTIVWDAGELDTLTPGTYTCTIQARNASTKDRKQNFDLIIEDVVLPV